MRLLVLDGSRVLPSLVRRLGEEGLMVEEVETFDQAVAALVKNPPDAVIANLGPTPLPWLEFKQYCQNHSPKIPVMFESCVYREPRDAGLDDLNESAIFITKPYSLEDLRRAIRLLLVLSRKCRVQPQDQPVKGTRE